MNKHRIYIVAVALTLGPCIAHAVEFNDAFLQLDPSSSVSLEQFEQAGYIVPGRYIADVYLNQRFLQQLELDFRPEGADQTVRPCLPPELIRQLGLRSGIVWPQNEQCVDLSAVSAAKVRYSKSNARLDISVPQAELAYRDEDYAPPETWNDGVPAAMLDYRVFYQRTDNGLGASSSKTTSYGVAGANAGPWRLRSNYQYDDSATNRSRLSWNNTQVYRDLRGMQARLTLGEVFKTSEIFDAFSMRGATLNSDDRMIPQSLRGYAPQVNGVAKTNAKVTIRNQGRVLYTTNVPPGPFSIRDLNSSTQGQLDVTVEEADGSQQTFTVNTASVPFLTRNGMWRYKAAIGQADQNGSASHPNVASAEASYGLTQTLSLYSGFIASADYRSLAMGFAKDLGNWGALSADVTQANAQMRGGLNMAGRSYRFNYAKKFESLDADIRLFGYRFSDRNFRSFGQFLSDLDGQNYISDKQRVGMTASKTFGQTNVFLSAEKSTYWNAAATQRVDLSLSRDVNIGSLRNVSLNLSVQNLRDQTGSSNRVYLGLSMPLENNRRIGYDVQGSAGNTNHTVRYSDSSKPNHSYNVAMSADTSSGKPLVSGDYHYTGRVMQADVSASKQQGGYSSLSAGMGSSLVLHAGGLTMGNSYGGETRMLVDTDGVAGVPVYGVSAQTDRNGYAMLSSVAPYYSQDVRLDDDNMPDSVEASSAVRRVVLTEGAVGRTEFPVKVGRKALLTVRLPDGKMPPLGATVSDVAGKRDVGMVGDGGLTFVTGLSPAPKLEISWGKTRCRVDPLPADYDLSQGGRDMMCTPLAE
ncbi:fimbrial biogenesis outer membrane usher protein [Chromobacterium alkanivorans]|uniref:fimbria/pilus outer membrane usher protein n=1 Tax=Chromobacterium alkanivorans TaxID=1071719 RepID=UPI00196783D7|nr:fimbria/pilus outer membrane usher protein [Chromobacterium alkanivorans]MBN3003243.1 fimbrial biogenesis outer membrane usher protein [Chromobacterium alkanivorans]